jgi:flagellar basal body-associated protein FliL
MKKELLIRLIIIVLTILILLGFLSYFSFLIKKSNNKTYKIQKFSEEKCDDKYCIYNLSVKYIDKKRSYYKLKGIVYYKSEEVIDKYLGCCHFFLGDRQNWRLYYEHRFPTQ